ncbi:MAG: hypothetical protein KAR39_07490 [Thermoplasmata archaeon]|nr:hypothetical protein [Thermoplasmata archaeon]
MKDIIQTIYDELKTKIITIFRTTGEIPNQSIAITQNLMRIPFDRLKGVIPASALGVHPTGYVGIPSAIEEGFVVGIFVSNFGIMAKHDLFALKPDYLHLDKRNFLWFELNSRIINIREAFYIDHNHEPAELQLIPNKLFDEVVENDIIELFKLHS